MIPAAVVVAIGFVHVRGSRAQLSVTSVQQQSTAQVKGRVTRQDDGAPIQGVKMTLFTHEGADGFSETEMTDPNGEYAFKFAGSDAYHVTASAEGFVSSLYASALTPVGLDSQKGQSSTGTSLDFRLMHEAVIRGVVLNAEGKPIGAGVRLMAVGGEKFPVPGFSAVNATTTTDANGQFTLRGLPPAIYSVRVDRRVTSPTAGIVIGRPGDLEQIWVGHAISSDGNLTLQAGEAENDIRITVKPAKHYNVVVWPSGPEGFPVPAYYQVELHGWTTAQKQADGSYLIPNIPAGRYTLISTAWLDGNPWTEGQGMTNFEVLNTDVTLHVNVGGIGKIHGVVKWEGAPAPLLESLRIGIQALEGQGGGSVHPDLNGNFWLQRVLPGRYVFRLDNEPSGTVWRSAICNGAEVKISAPLRVGDSQQLTDCEIALRR